MTELLDSVTKVIRLLSTEKVKAIAYRVKRSTVAEAAMKLPMLVGTPAALAAVMQMVEAWKASGVSADEVSAMLISASHVLAGQRSLESIELVWTGPTTPFVSPRRTEQALQQVIGSATKTLFLTSFVAYDVKSIVSELNVAASRDVSVAMILEASSEHGGSISIDVIGKMRDLVPSARLYGWNDKQGEFSGGRVHAKVAVADSSVCFITSANLTGYAMERNMEAGVLITGGEIPRQLSSHLESLIDLRVVEPV